MTYIPSAESTWGQAQRPAPNDAVELPGGAVGAAVARAFAREGARVFLAGRTQTTLESVAQAIRAAGSAAEVGQVDALDAQAVETHLSAVIEKQDASMSLST